jgi:hypothetical protein
MAPWSHRAPGINRASLSKLEAGASYPGLEITAKGLFSAAC